MTKSELLDLFDDSRPHDIDDSFEITTEIKLLQKTNSKAFDQKNSTVVNTYQNNSSVVNTNQNNSTVVNTNQNDSTVVNTSSLFVENISVDSSESKPTIHKVSSKKTEDRGYISSSGSPSIKRARPTILIPKRPFTQVDLTWKPVSNLEKYYFNRNRFSKPRNVLKREITNTPVRVKGERGSMKKNSNSFQKVNSIASASNKTKAFSFANPTSYSRPTYFKDAQILPLSLAPPVPPIVTVSPSNNSEQPSPATLNNVIRPAIPLNHRNMMFSQVTNPFFPNHNHQAQHFSDTARPSGSKFSITAQPSHPGLFLIDPASRLRPHHPGNNAIPGKSPFRFRTPLHPPPIVTKSVTEAPGSAQTKQSVKPNRPSLILPGVPLSSSQPGAPPSLIQRPPGRLTTPRNRPSGQRPRRKRRPVTSDSDSNQNAGQWPNLLQRLTGLRSAFTTQQTRPVPRPVQKHPDPLPTFVNEVPVGLTPPSVVKNTNNSLSQESEKSSKMNQGIPMVQGSFGIQPNPFHTLSQTRVAKSPKIPYSHQTGQLIVHNNPAAFAEQGQGFQVVPLNNIQTVSGVFPYEHLRQLHRVSPSLLEAPKEETSRSSGETSTSDESKTLSTHMLPPPALDIFSPTINSSRKISKRHQLPLGLPAYSSAQKQMTLHPVMSPYAYPTHQLVTLVRTKSGARKISNVPPKREDVSSKIFPRHLFPQPQYLLQPRFPILIKTAET